MSPSFDCAPTLPRLRSLVHNNNLKQHLPKAVRLWVVISSIYGNADDYHEKLELRDSFTYTQWHNEFFKDTKEHHLRDKLPLLHSHPQCPCKKNLDSWLFQDNVSKKEWLKSFRNQYSVKEEKDLELFLKTAIWPSKLRNNEQENTNFPDGYIFACTGKTLQNDFKALVDLGYLSKSKVKIAQYTKVTKFPIYEEEREAVHDKETDERPPTIESPNVDSIAQLYSQQINGIQRFSIHVDYIVSKEGIDIVDDWGNELKDIWSKTPVNLIRKNYLSASLGVEVSTIIYPVCLHYFQRAIYLCAYGQRPKDLKNIDWYNYRVDRIIKITELTWQDSNIPDMMLNKYLRKALPTPDDVRRQLQEAWGFDFYQPKQTMLLRFEGSFGKDYIKDSFRHETFKQLTTIKEFQELIGSFYEREDQEEVRTIIKQIQSDTNIAKSGYIYCKAQYRNNDNNVLMRLRAWGPKVKILLPKMLKERITRDIQATTELYKKGGK